MKKYSRLSTLLIFVLLINLVVSLFIVSPVKGAQTTLSIVSPVQDICAGSELTVMVRIADVTDLYALDVLLTYNPAVIEVLGLTETNFVPAPKTTLLSSWNNTTGSLRYAMTRIGGGVGVTGTGDILAIRLKVKTAGPVQFSFVTTGTIRTKLSDSLSRSITYIIGDTGSTVGHSCQVHFPSSSRIVCGLTTLQVRIEDILDLYGYDITITYDPSVIRVDAVRFDTSFINLTIFTIIDTSTPGVIRVYGSQANPAPPATGSGGLIFIDAFPLIVNRDSGLTISSSSEFSTRYGDLIPVSVDNHPVWTYSCDPNAVDLKSFDVLRKSKKAILTWETASEIDILGFNIYRSGKKDGTLKKMNPEIIHTDAVGTTDGAQYEFINYSLKPWKTYFYWLESVGMSEEETTLYGPYKAAPPR